MARRLVLLAVAASALGVTAPSANARCASDFDPVCIVQCAAYRLLDVWCKA